MIISTRFQTFFAATNALIVLLKNEHGTERVSSAYLQWLAAPKRLERTVDLIISDAATCYNIRIIHRFAR